MYLTLLVIANLKACVLPTSVLDGLEIQAEDTTPTGKPHIANAVKSKSDLPMRRNLLLHHQLNAWPSSSVRTLRLPTIKK